MAHEQSEQRSEQKASAQEAAVAVMMTMAAVATKDHVPQGQNTKQTQHCDVPPFQSFLMYRSFGTCTGYGRRRQKNRIKSDNYGRLFFH